MVLVTSVFTEASARHSVEGLIAHNSDLLGSK